MFRKYNATVTLYRSFCKSNLKIQIDNQEEYMNADIHQLFKKEFYEKVIDHLQYSNHGNLMKICLLLYLIKHSILKI